jgi:hypothetical protein
MSGNINSMNRHTTDGRSGQANRMVSLCCDLQYSIAGDRGLDGVHAVENHQAVVEVSCP